MPTKRDMYIGRLVWRVIFDQAQHISWHTPASFMRERRKQLGGVAREMFKAARNDGPK